MFSIWAERQIFEQSFLDELSSLLDPESASKEEQNMVDNFQPNQLCTQLKIIKALEDDTDYKLKTLKDNELDLIDTEALRQTLKDRQHGNDYIGDFDEGRKRMELYIKALEKEINKRRQVVELLSQGTKYYASLLGEADIVATAYSNFGKRIKNLKKKLTEERMTELENLVSISPMPSPPNREDAVPSPTQGDDVEMELELPDEAQTAAPIIVNDLNSRLDSMRDFITKPPPPIPLPLHQEPPQQQQQQQPIPEWQIEARDEEPLAENDEVYNKALARLNKRAAAEREKEAQEQHHHHNKMGKFDGPPPNVMFSHPPPPPPPPPAAPQLDNNIKANNGGSGNHTSLQNRLKSLASVAIDPPAEEEGGRPWKHQQADDYPQQPPPPSPRMRPPHHGMRGPPPGPPGHRFPPPPPRGAFRGGPPRHFQHRPPRGGPRW